MRSKHRKYYRYSLFEVSKRPMSRSSKGILTKIWLNEGSLGRGIRTPYKRSPGFSTWHSAELGEAQRPAHEDWLLVDGLIGLVSRRGAPGASLRLRC